MAALYQDELYEMVTARGGVARLQQFGVVFGYMRVVIYVEPAINGSHQVVANTARTHLLLDNAPLPWADWATEFREQMPEEITALMEEVTAGATSSDHRQAIKDRLKQVRDLFNSPGSDGLRLARSRSRATRSAARRRRLTQSTATAAVSGAGAARAVVLVTSTPCSSQMKASPERKPTLSPTRTFSGSALRKGPGRPQTLTTAPPSTCRRRTCCS